MLSRESDAMPGVSGATSAFSPSSPSSGDVAARRRRYASVRRSVVELGQTLASRWQESHGGGRRCELTRVLGEVLYEPHARDRAGGTPIRTGDQARTSVPKCLLMVSLAKSHLYERTTLHALRFANAARIGGAASNFSVEQGTKFLREQAFLLDMIDQTRRQA